MMKKIILLFVLVAVAFAQIGKYTHFVSGGYNRAGYRIANEFGAWNTNSNKFDNLPKVTFGGSVSDIAPAGNGFLVVGDFTTVNGDPANGLAYYDGTKWCGFPHLNLYAYPKPNPPDTRFPKAGNQAGSPGSATAIYQSGNSYYIFGGLNPNTGKPRFNQVGTVIVGVAGLAKLNFDGSGNFTLDNTLNYLTQGQGFPNEFNGNGFPADSAPSTTIGRTKLRVINAGGVVSYYVHPNVGSNSHLFRWRQNDGAWLRVTQSTFPVTGFNVSGVPTTFSVTAFGINGCNDFDADVTGNVVFCAGAFDNSQNTTSNVRYVHVACSGNAQSTGIQWTVAVNWPNINNFNNSGQFASAISVVNQNQFYVAIPFQSRDTNDNLIGQNQYYVYSVGSGGTPTIIGGRFAKADGSAPNIRKLSFYNNKIYAFGDFSLIDYVFDQANVWPRRYTRKISGAVSYDGTNWQNAYGGFTPLSTSANVLPLAAPVSGYDYVWFSGATQYYSLYSAGSFVAYNKDSLSWENMANQRFIVRGGQTGTDGGIAAVHFIRKQRDGVTDAIVVAGQFDWYGSQYLASVAFFRTGNQQFEQLGQGVFTDEAGASFSGDQVFPIYRAGTVYDIEEIGTNFYVGGAFTKNINGKCLGNIAVVPTTGGTFDTLGSGCDGTIWDLLGDGNTLYVGGDFTSCNGVQGTRRIAAWDTDKKVFNPLSTGFADGRVYAMIKWRGKLYVGGSFGTAPASYRVSGPAVTGLYSWDTQKWAPVYARCQKDCDLGEFTVPFNGQDPLFRSVSQVRSLRAIGGNLYVQGQVTSGSTQYLIQYDGSYFRQYGSSTGNAGCLKQGCLASNNSNIIGAGFSRAQGTDSYNNNYLQYDPDKKNWIETNTGFEGTPVIVASANFVALSIFSLLIVILMAL